MSRAMNNIIKDNDKDQFANGQISRDLRANWGGTEPQTRLDAVNVIEQCPDVAREEFSASENWERVRQWRVSRFLPEQIDADERLPGYLREPHLPRFESPRTRNFEILSALQTDRGACAMILRRGMSASKV
jgi:hypothetical protein